MDEVKPPPGYPFESHARAEPDDQHGPADYLEDPTDVETNVEEVVRQIHRETLLALPAPPEPSTPPPTSPVFVEADCTKHVTLLKDAGKSVGWQCNYCHEVRTKINFTRMRRHLAGAAGSGIKPCRSTNHFFLNYVKPVFAKLVEEARTNSQSRGAGEINSVSGNALSDDDELVNNHGGASSSAATLPEAQHFFLEALQSTARKSEVDKNGSALASLNGTPTAKSEPNHLLIHQNSHGSVQTSAVQLGSVQTGSQHLQLPHHLPSPHFHQQSGHSLSASPIPPHPPQPKRLRTAFSSVPLLASYCSSSVAGKPVFKEPFWASCQAPIVEFISDCELPFQLLDRSSFRHMCDAIFQSGVRVGKESRDKI